jgi:3-hydroxyacyl-[acyl-carrier-protein] dehydratase
VNSLDINQIRKHLPHRYPFLLLDRVLDYTPDVSLKALKNVTVNEPFFQGHFPNRPVMPGVLIIEAMAQASAVLASVSLDAEAQDNRIYLFAGIDKVRFKKQVEPGDQMIFEVKFQRRIRRIWKCSVAVKVEESLVSAAELLFTYQEI